MIMLYKNNCILNIFFIACFLFSCSGQDNSFEKIINSANDVSCVEIPVDFLLGKPYQLKLQDSLLLIADNIDGKALSIYDYKNSKLINHILDMGQGPNEILVPILLNNSKDRTGVASILQRQNGVYTEYQLSDLQRGVVNPIKKISFKNIDRIIKINIGYIAEGEYNRGSIGLFNELGCLICVKNIYPNYINEIEHESDKYILGQGHVEFNNEAAVFAFASYFTGEIVFYKLLNNNINMINYYNLDKTSAFENRIKSNPQNLKIQKTDIEHSTDIYSTLNCFYILYSGQKMEDKNRVKYSYILRFSQQGKFICSYRTNLKVNNFCVTEDDKKIYAIALSEKMEYVLVEINIDKFN